MKFKTPVQKAIFLLVPLLGTLAHAETAVPPQRREYGKTPHEHYDEVLHEVFWDITIIGIVFALVSIYLLIVYRRRSADEVGRLPRLSPQAAIGWFVIPTFLFMADDFFLFAKAWELHNHYREVPEDPYEVKVTGQIWSWTYTYPNGKETYNELRVPVDKPVLLRMNSKDVVHSHFMPYFRVTEDLMPGRVTYMWFMPDKVGEYVVTCREYCGLGHSRMYGKIIVMEKPAFQTWLASYGEPEKETETAQAAQVEASAAEKL